MCLDCAGCLGCTGLSAERVNPYLLQTKPLSTFLSNLIKQFLLLHRNVETSVWLRHSTTLCVWGWWRGVETGVTTIMGGWTWTFKKLNCQKTKQKNKTKTNSKSERLHENSVKDNANIKSSTTSENTATMLMKYMPKSKTKPNAWSSPCIKLAHKGLTWQGKNDDNFCFNCVMLLWSIDGKNR